MGRRLGVFVLSLGLACGGCEGEGVLQDGPRKQGGAQAGGEVVSTVDGFAITRKDVEGLVAASGLSPRAAVELLQREQLLMGEAARRGYGSSREVERVSAQARVQALLEQEVEVLEATDAEVSGAFEAQRARFEHPERRAAVHVLASLKKSASTEDERLARAFATEVARELAAANDPEEVFARYRGREVQGVSVRVETLPLSAKGRFVPEFDAALFGVERAGPVAGPVRTSFGYHAIYVTNIVPEKPTDVAAARRTLAAEITVAKRKARLDAMLGSLRKQARVERDPAGGQALGALEL